MSRARVRVEVPSRHKAYDVVIDTEASPMVVAKGLATQLFGGEAEGRVFYLRLKDSFNIADGATLELVGDKRVDFEFLNEEGFEIEGGSRGAT